MINNMHNDIEREYERLEEYKDNRVVGGVIRQTENAINEWEDRLTTELDEEKQPNFKIGEVYATQIKDMERLVYDEDTYGYKTTPVEFKGSKEKFISSLYTFFTFDEIVPSDNLENIITGDLPKMHWLSYSKAFRLEGNSSFYFAQHVFIILVLLIYHNFMKYANKSC